MRPIKFGLMMLSNQQYQIHLDHGQIPFAADPFRYPGGCSTAVSASQTVFRISKTFCAMLRSIASTSSNGLHCKVILIWEKMQSHTGSCLGCMTNDELTECGVWLKTAAKLGRGRRRPGTRIHWIRWHKAHTKV